MKKYFISLRTYIAATSSLTFGLFNVFSCALVWGAFYSVYGGELGFWQGVGLSVLNCVLTIGLNFSFLYFGLKFLLRPIKRIKDTINAIANGDFSARAKRKLHPSKQNFTYMHELDEVIVDVNKMAAHLQQHEALQKEFVANVSHEIKTPIASIAGFSELMLESSEISHIKNYASVVKNEASRLQKLCDDLLNLARLENVSIVKSADVCIDESLRNSVIILMQKYEGREFELDLRASSAQTNSVFLAQLWQNLIENALKYSPHHTKIYISCFEEQNHVKVAIKDYGVGIEPSKQAKIFERFYQCEEAHSKQGSGLGLSIVAKIISLLGLSLELKSAPSVGTTIFITIPKIFTKEHTQNT